MLLLLGEILKATASDQTQAVTSATVGPGGSGDPAAKKGASGIMVFVLPGALRL